MEGQRISPDQPDEAAIRSAEALAELVRPLLQHRLYPEFFRMWEEQGFHISRANYYSPIPRLTELPESVWTRKSDLAAIDMRREQQLQLLTEAFPRFRSEYDGIPREPTGAEHEYHFDNGMFSGTDALVLYCMVRHFRPRRVLEIGSGYSSRLAAQAAVKNGSTALTCVEPYPDEVLQKGFPGLHTLIPSKVQDVDPAVFTQLMENDILFIDSSHTVKIGSDVNYLFLDILPQLNPGVLVHVHDVFLPLDYPRSWTVEHLLFWAEQYLLQAFLMFNSEFEVVFANSYAESCFPEPFRATFPNSPWWGGGSFWMRRKRAAKSIIP